jgi:hypothetical protein
MEKTQEEDYIRTIPPRRSITQNQQPIIEGTQEEDYRRETPFKRSPTLRYQTIFLVLCYSCNIFGHKDINCRAHAKNKSNYEGYSRINHLINPHEAYNINYNNFGSLNNELECYNATILDTWTKIAD